LNNKGLDSDGYVATNIKRENISASFKSVLADAIKSLESVLDENLHSIYLYGSVGRGTAVYGQSDFDLSVIVKTEVSEETGENLSDLEKALCDKYESISKLEFDLGTIKEALIDNEYEWKFWLKHLCVCVWGEDLRDEISPYKPSMNIGLEMNKDISRRLSNASSRLNEGNYQAEGKSIAKKLLRTHYSLFSERDGSFYESLTDLTDCLKGYEPSLEGELSSAFRMAMGTVKAQDEVSSLIENYGNIVVSRFRENGGLTT